MDDRPEHSDFPGDAFGCDPEVDSGEAAQAWPSESLRPGSLGVVVSPDIHRMGELADELAVRIRSDLGQAVAVVDRAKAVDGLYPRFEPLSCLIVVAPEAPACTRVLSPCPNPWCRALLHLKQIATFRSLAVLVICPLEPTCDECGRRPPFQSKDRESCHRAMVADFIWRGRP